MHRASHIQTARFANVVKRLEWMVSKGAQKVGYEVQRAPNFFDLTRQRKYEPVRPMATYSPWNIDGPFQETYDQIKDHTLVDKYRCFELWQLVEQSSKLPSGSLIEVGVWRGGTGALIAKQAKRCGIRERAFLCDTFSGVVKATSRDSIYKGGEHGDASRLGVERFLSALEIEVGGILEGVFPDQTGRELEDRRFRFCHIDVDTYDSAKDVFEWVWDRLVPGGIVVFDDYGFWSCDGVTAYVEEISAAPDRLVLHNLNGHAVFVKIGL